MEDQNLGKFQIEEDSISRLNTILSDKINMEIPQNDGFKRIKVKPRSSKNKLPKIEESSMKKRNYRRSVKKQTRQIDQIFDHNTIQIEENIESQKDKELQKDHQKQQGQISHIFENKQNQHQQVYQNQNIKKLTQKINVKHQVKAQVIEIQGFWSNHLKIHFGGNQLIFSKPMKSFRSNSIQIMAINQQLDDKIVIGTLERNWKGSQYRLVSEGQILCQIYYNDKFYCKNQARKVEVYIAMSSIDANINLAKLYEEQGSIKVNKLMDKQPTQINGKFMLDFNIKNQIIPSTKNVILTDATSETVLKMYKCFSDKQQYQVLFGYPFCNLSAYAYILSSLNFKIFTQ